VEGTQEWVAETFADILEKPGRYDLPCLWYDPIRVNRRLKLETPIQWEEYTLTLYPLPGHTRYAVAIYFEVDGCRVLATGDQYQGNDGLEFNYVYANRFDAGDYVKSAELYRDLHPHVIISGHWRPLWVTPDYLDQIQLIGTEIERLHHDLLLDNVSEEFIARLSPYQVTAHRGETIEFEADIHNPYPYSTEALVQTIVPARWRMVNATSTETEVEQKSSGAIRLELGPQATHTITFQIVSPPDATARRARIGVDVQIGVHRFGQQAEALVTIIP
jgi:glyoxylase-like metal-dependent hydrolase (beta-lactamase superfamily II)